MLLFRCQVQVVSADTVTVVLKFCANEADDGSKVTSNPRAARSCSVFLLFFLVLVAVLMIDGTASRG